MMSSVPEEHHSIQTDEYSFLTATDHAAQERSSLEDEDWEFLSENYSVFTISSMATMTTFSYKDALLSQQDPLATTTTGTSCVQALDNNQNSVKRKERHQTTNVLKDTTVVDDPALSMYDFTKTDRGTSSHTMRRNVSCPDAAQRREFMGPSKVMDKDHVPLTKTWGCKLREHRSGRQWLQKQRRHEKHVDRRCRKEFIRHDLQENV